MSQYPQYIVPSSDEMLNLGVGQPSPQFLNEYRILLNEATNTTNPMISDRMLLQYGSIKGFIEFRKAVINMLSRSVNLNDDDITHDNVFMTNGISHGIFMLASLLKNGNINLDGFYSNEEKKTNFKTVYVENPTYFIGLDIFRKDLGYDVKTFDIDNLDKLRSDLEKEEGNSIIYIVPFHQNPTGRSINHAQRLEFIDIVNKHKVMVFSDETYQMLSFSSPDYDLIQPLSIYSNKILSFGTFSKIFAPALRLGWILTKNKQVLDYLSTTGYLDSGGSVNPIVAHLVCKSLVIQSGDQVATSFEIILDAIKSWLMESCMILVEELRKYPDMFEFTVPTGGYFLWVKTKKISAEKLLEISKRHKVSFHVGNKFSSDGSYSDYFRLSYSYYEPEDLYKFSERLENIVNEIKKRDKILVLGGSGKLGSLIISEAKEADFLVEKIGRDHDYNLTEGSDNVTIVDVSSPEGTKTLLTNLLDRKIYLPVLIGTTGDLPHDLINQYATKSQIAVIPNFSIGMASIFSFLTKLPRKWEVEIAEAHHYGKKDSPSGTATRLKECLNDKTDNPISIDVERHGDIIGIHEIILKNTSEEITIKHHATRRDIFAKGCIEHVKWLKKKPIGLYNSIIE